MKYIDMFIEDCKYYDTRQTEVKNILKYSNIKRKKVLDIGAGIGRLSFPLAKYAGEIIALDKDERFRDYFKTHKRKNIKFVNKRVEDYLKNNKKFDIILLAWPTFSFDLKVIGRIKKAMYNESLFIFITCDSNSDYETVVDKLGLTQKCYFDKDISNKASFIRFLPKKFKLISKKRIKTEYVYPSKSIAFRILNNSMKMWFNINLDRKQKEKLERIIKKHKRGKKIKFNEIIYFYIFKK